MDITLLNNIKSLFYQGSILKTINSFILYNDLISKFQVAYFSETERYSTKFDEISFEEITSLYLKTNTLDEIILKLENTLKIQQEFLVLCSNQEIDSENFDCLLQQIEYVDFRHQLFSKMSIGKISPLFLLVSNEITDSQKINKLLQKGANPNLIMGSYNKESTPFYQSVNLGHYEVVKLFYQYNFTPQINFKNVDLQEYSTLLHACLNRYSFVNESKLEERNSLLRFLLEKGENPNALNKLNLPPIYSTISLKNKQMVSTLLDFGIDINYIPKPQIGFFINYYYTPLAFAANSGFIDDFEKNKDFFDFLIENGAKLNEINQEGRNALYGFIYWKDIKMLAHCKDLSANFEIKDIYGKTPFLQYFTLESDLNFLKEFIKLGVNINTQDLEGETALHKAVLNNRPDIVKLLVDNNIEIYTKNKIGKTAGDLAIEKDLKSIVGLLNGNKNFVFEEQNAWISVIDAFKHGNSFEYEKLKVEYNHKHNKWYFKYDFDFFETNEFWVKEFFGEILLKNTETQIAHNFTYWLNYYLIDLKIKTYTPIELKEELSFQNYNKFLETSIDVENIVLLIFDFLKINLKIQTPFKPSLTKVIHYNSADNKFRMEEFGDSFGVNNEISENDVKSFIKENVFIIEYFGVKIAKTSLENSVDYCLQKLGFLTTRDFLNN